MSKTPSNGIDYVPENTIDPAAGLNLSLNQIDALLQCAVVSVTNTPPGSPVEGARYAVGSAPTGAWAGYAGKLAVWTNGQWLFYTAKLALNLNDGKLWLNTTGTWAVLPTGQFTGGTLSAALNEAPPVTLASAATVAIGAATANTINISGTATITAFDISAAGAVRRLVFQDAATLTHNATSLILPTGANIVAAAGDVGAFVSLGSGNWKCTSWQRAASADMRADAGLGSAAVLDAATLVGTAGTQTITGLKTFTGAQVRIQSAIPGFWLDETDGSAGIYIVLDAGNLQFQVRNPSWGTVVSSAFNIDTVNAINKSGYNLTPSTDNNRTCGAASLRWSTVYAGTGTINTSDAREKTSVRSLTAPELAAAKQLASEIGAYQFLTAVTEKGSAARQHIGMTVQRAIEIMRANDLDPFAYGFICYDQWGEQTADHPEEYEQVLQEDGSYADGALVREAWTEVVREAGDRYSFRMDELLAFVARGQAARLDDLEQKLSSLVPSS